MRKLLPLIIGLSLSQSAIAENLLQVYQQAKSSNPELISAAAERDKAYAAITGSRASLLPQLGLNASYGVSNGFRANKDINAKTGNLSLSLTQTLFNYASWQALTISQKQAGIQDIAFEAQQQNLILTTSTNYFQVLRALEALNVIQAQKKAIARQLEQTRQKFDVGLVAITDVQNAQANYDQTVAQEVTARNNLNTAVENLRQVSGQFYNHLASININRFKTELPPSVDRLLKESTNRNLSLLTARLSRDLAKEQIRLAQSGYMPTVTVQASSSLNKNQTYGEPLYATGRDTNTITGNNQVSINLNLPIFSGGATYSQVKQAQYNYVSYSQQLESTNRKMINQVRSSYNNIAASISAIRAYEQTVKSAESSLKATQAGYDVGTRTIVDVLNATTTLYNAKQQLSNAKYDYLISQLNLKAAVGNLTEDDLVALNNMLGASVAINLEQYY